MRQADRQRVELEHREWESAIGSICPRCVRCGKDAWDD